MRVVYGSIELADGVTTHTRDDGFGCQQQNQTVPLLRAERQKLYGRGNRLNAVSFSVSRKFDSIDDAKEFVYTHESTLPIDGLLDLETGSGVLTADALFDSLSIRRQGLRVDVAYQFSAGKFRMATPLIDSEGQSLSDAEGEPLFA